MWRCCLKDLPYVFVICSVIGVDQFLMILLPIEVKCDYLVCKREKEHVLSCSFSLLQFFFLFSPFSFFSLYFLSFVLKGFQLASASVFSIHYHN